MLSLIHIFTLGVTYDTTRPQLEKLMADLDAMLKASPDTYEDTAFVYFHLRRTPISERSAGR